MSELPLVSILMPAHNVAAYVDVAIQSVLSQTWENWELIVVDDGSTDETAPVIDAYANYDRITIIHQVNQGAAAARNRAYAESSGDLVKFFDGDDLLSPKFVERQVRCLKGSDEHVASAEWARFYDDPDEADFTSCSVWKDMDPVDWLVTAWQDARPMMQPALWLIPRTLLGDAPWDDRLTLIDDFEFGARLLTRAEHILFAEGARLYYRSGLGQSLSGQQSRKHVESAFLSLMIGTQHLLDVEDSPRTREAAANMLQDFVYAYYPRHDDLRARMKARIDELGGSTLAPTGPPGFQLLRRVAGWKVARRIERFARRHGLTRSAILSSS